MKTLVIRVVLLVWFPIAMLDRNDRKDWFRKWKAGVL